MNIYVASSWRNPFQPAVIGLLREHGHEVYNFREPVPGDNGFHWSQVNKKPPEKWSANDHRMALEDPIAERGFGYDMGALERSQACLLVLPCGRSAHLELGIAVGAGKITAVLFPNGLRPDAPTVGPVEPELMLKAADEILVGASELRHWAISMRVRDAIAAGEAR